MKYAIEKAIGLSTYTHVWSKPLAVWLYIYLFQFG